MALATQYLTVVRSIIIYIGYFVKSIFKSGRKSRQEELLFALTHMNSADHEVTHKPITKSDAATGVVYCVALLKAIRLQNGSATKDYFILFGKKAKGAKNVATVRGQPVFYVLNDILKMSGYELRSVGFLLGCKDMCICTIAKT